MKRTFAGHSIHFLLLGLAALCLSARSARAAGADAYLGRWRTDRGAQLEFLPEGVGREAEPGGRVFRYAVAGDAAILITFGGATNTAVAVISGDALSLAGGGTTSNFQRAEGGVSGCRAGLAAIEVAKALFRAEHPGAEPLSVSDLVPAYLSAMPACPSDGIYALGAEGRKATCNVHGHEAE